MANVDIDPTIERMLDQHPLIAFSVYTDGQVEILLDLVIRLRSN